MKTIRHARYLPRLADPDANLAQTLRVLHERRRLLALLGGAGPCAVLPRSPLACTLIPQETEGPYPGDGTNGPNALAASGIVRPDIRSSVGIASPATAAGTPRAWRCSSSARRTAAARSRDWRSTPGTATPKAATRCTRKA